MKEFREKINELKGFSGLLFLAVFVSFLFLIFINFNFSLSHKMVASILDNISQMQQSDSFIKNEKLANPPKEVKGIYLTGWSAGRKASIDYVINLSKSVGVNAVVIDLKDYSGYVNYDISVPEVVNYKAKQIKIPKINALVQRLHQAGIYVIGRIAVFQDPILAAARPEWAVHKKSDLVYIDKQPLFTELSLWKDNKGLAWIDPASESAWEYNINIAKDAFSRGFDEINFDYIRFPSDGNLGNMIFSNWDMKISRHLVMKSFFSYVRTSLAGEKISADLFGLATINKDDLGIGQVIEDAYENFDYICPMVYPSHYASGFSGFANPALYPYEVVKKSMDTAEARRKDFYLIKDLANKSATDSESIEVQPVAKLRPWLQDFNMGAVYDVKKVSAQIQATKDSLGADYVGYLLWNPSNIYTSGAIINPLENPIK